MKLAISNIAWENDRNDEYLSLVKNLGCTGIEIAPSCIWPEPILTTQNERRAFREKVKKIGLELVGFHALLFTRPDLQLFESLKSRQETGEYLKKLFQLCSDLGGKNLVFGSPRNRKLHGLDYEQALSIAVDFFRGLMPAAQECDIHLCFEALSPLETDFIISSEEVMYLIEHVSHPRFGLHLDAKAMIESKENFQAVFSKYGKLLRHFHVGDPGLSPPGTTGFDHRLIGDALKTSGYEGFVSIEMRRSPNSASEVIKKSIGYVKENYHIN